MSLLGYLNFNPNPATGRLSYDGTMPMLCCDPRSLRFISDMAEMDFFGGEIKLLLSEKAHSRSCIASVPCKYCSAWHEPGHHNFWSYTFPSGASLALSFRNSASPESWGGRRLNFMMEQCVILAAKIQISFIMKAAFPQR